MSAAQPASINMSHELRTPLAAMLGYAELLQEGIYGQRRRNSCRSLGMKNYSPVQLLRVVRGLLGETV